jgi:hypothetical protein
MPQAITEPSDAPDSSEQALYAIAKTQLRDKLANSSSSPFITQQHQNLVNAIDALISAFVQKNNFTDTEKRDAYFKAQLYCTVQTFLNTHADNYEFNHSKFGKSLQAAFQQFEQFEQTIQPVTDHYTWHYLKLIQIKAVEPKIKKVDQDETDYFALDAKQLETQVNARVAKTSATLYKNHLRDIVIRLDASEHTLRAATNTAPAMPAPAGRDQKVAYNLMAQYHNYLAEHGHKKKHGIARRQSVSTLFSNLNGTTSTNDLVELYVETLAIKNSLLKESSIFRSQYKHSRLGKLSRDSLRVIDTLKAKDSELQTTIDQHLRTAGLLKETEYLENRISILYRLTHIGKPLPKAPSPTQRNAF